MQLIRLQVNVFLRLQIIWREALWIKAESARGAVKAKVRLILKPQLSTTIKKRSFPSRGLFSFFSFLFHIPPHTCLLQEAMMSASQPSGNWQGGECVCVHEEGLFISNPGFLFPLCSDSHNNTQLCEFMLCPFPLSFSVSVFLYHSPFLSSFPSKKWISPLYTPLSNYFGEEGGKRGRDERGVTFKKRVKKEYAAFLYCSTQTQ